MLKRSKRGQSLIEYILLIIITLGVFVSISNYFKRGIQGRWKTAVDEMGDQYDPRTAVTDILHTVDSTTVTEIRIVDAQNGYWTNRVDMVNSRDARTGSMTVGAY